MKSELFVKGMGKQFGNHSGVNGKKEFSDSIGMNDSKRIKCSVTEYRYSVVSGMEAYIRWSLGRSYLWPEHAFSFMLITVVKEHVHVSVTEVHGGMFETHQWLLSSCVSLDEIVSSMGQMLDLRLCRYIFLPGRMDVMSQSSCVCSMTRKAWMDYFPWAKVLRVDVIARASSRVSVRRIGADVRGYVESLDIQKGLVWYGYSNEHDALTSAVEADSALLLRVMMTPVSVYMDNLGCAACSGSVSACGVACGKR